MQHMFPEHVVEDDVDEKLRNAMFLERLRYIRSHSCFRSASLNDCVKLSGTFTCTWNRHRHPALQISSTLNAWNEQDRWTIKPVIQVVANGVSDSCDTRFLAVLKIEDAIFETSVALRLLLVTERKQFIPIGDVGAFTKLTFTVEPLTASTNALMIASILTVEEKISRQEAQFQRSLSVYGQQSIDARFVELYSKARSSDIVEDLKAHQRLADQLRVGIAEVVSSAVELSDRLQGIAPRQHEFDSVAAERIHSIIEGLRKIHANSEDSIASLATQLQCYEVLRNIGAKDVAGLDADNRCLGEDVQKLQLTVDDQNQRIAGLLRIAERHGAILDRQSLLG